MKVEPLFDFYSFARRGAERRVDLSAADLATIKRITSRAPEVMVKVLSHGAVSTKAVRKHVEYVSRAGEVNVESDSGEAVRGDIEDHLSDWDLDVEEMRPVSALQARSRPPARLIHKIIFSMPAGTLPAKVLQGARNFAREEFALKHRYLLALHTDEPHPHVHLVIKAMSEQGRRMHIRKATIRDWRESFAKHLRLLGVPANATRRYVRGEVGYRASDGIYRANLRGESTCMRERSEASEMGASKRDSPNKREQVASVAQRVAVVGVWSAISSILIREGQTELAAQIRRFVDEMPSTSGKTASQDRARRLHRTRAF